MSQFGTRVVGMRYIVVMSCLGAECLLIIDRLVDRKSRVIPPMSRTASAARAPTPTWPC